MMINNSHSKRPFRLNGTRFSFHINFSVLKLFRCSCGQVCVLRVYTTRIYSVRTRFGPCAVDVPNCPTSTVTIITIMHASDERCCWALFMRQHFNIFPPIVAHTRPAPPPTQSCPATTVCGWEKNERQKNNNFLLLSFMYLVCIASDVVAAFTIFACDFSVFVSPFSLCARLLLLAPWPLQCLLYTQYDGEHRMLTHTHTVTEEKCVHFNLFIVIIILLLLGPRHSHNAHTHQMLANICSIVSRRQHRML